MIPTKELEAYFPPCVKRLNELFTNRAQWRKDATYSSAGALIRYEGKDIQGHKKTLIDEIKANHPQWELNAATENDLWDKTVLEALSEWQFNDYCQKYGVEIYGEVLTWIRQSDGVWHRAVHFMGGPNEIPVSHVLPYLASKASRIANPPINI